MIKKWSKIFEPGQNIFKLADGVGSSETKYNSINLSWHWTLEPEARPKIIKDQGIARFQLDWLGGSYAKTWDLTSFP